tara:strand:- start:2415 stop:3476 length:1062 start_codon:yes stop_codon:yes gene_type:complete
MKNLKNHYSNKKVLVTGHTGFKGSWLVLWLKTLGAEIYGISNNYPTYPCNFKVLKLKKKINHKILDLRDLKKVKSHILKIKPDYIFHLAAQSLVKLSYKDPINTFSTNIMGTCNLLESIKHLKNKCNVVIITSDKSYKNMEIKRGYKENDLLGGTDPYSASKGSAELLIKSYYESFLKFKKNIRISISRAGNVIGGGDWSKDRILPDCVKAWSKGKQVIIRNPKSTRPWQHVIEVIFGYLVLAINLKKNQKLNGEAFNFGPKNSQDKNVISLLREIKTNWNSVKWKIKKNKTFKESTLLKLNSLKSRKKLRWSNKLTFEETIKLTIDWYKKYYSKGDILDYTISQIKNYEEKK